MWVDRTVTAGREQRLNRKDRASPPSGSAKIGLPEYGQHRDRSPMFCGTGATSDGRPGHGLSPSPRRPAGPAARASPAVEAIPVGSQPWRMSRYGAAAPTGRHVEEAL